MKSFAVRPSIGLPSLSFTVTVWTISRVVPCGRSAAVVAVHAASPQRTSRTTKRNARKHENTTTKYRVFFVIFVFSWLHFESPQNLSRRLVWIFRIVFARFGRPNCGLPTIVFTPGIGDAVEHVGRIDPPIETEPAAPRERPRQSRVQRELRGADDGVASGIAPSPGRGSGVRRRIRVVARRRGISRRAREVRADRAGHAGARDRCQIRPASAADRCRR